MTFQEGFQKSAARAERRSGGGRAIALGGGGIGSLLLVGIFILMGGNPNDLGSLGLSDGPAQGGRGSESAAVDECRTGADANARVDCRIEFTGISLDRVWERELKAQAGIDYTAPGLVLFESGTQSGCGRATASTGPFYCPADEKAYFDTSFFDTIARMGGGSGPLAQEYVVAHEFGHHIQKLEGTLGRIDYNNPGPDSDAVKLELQADCYAGIWAHFADEGPDAILETLTEEEVADALATTRAIGDDTIQKHSGGDIRPDLWTHGSAQARTDAFLAGYNSGRMAQCDTLNRGVYR